MKPEADDDWVLRWLADHGLERLPDWDDCEAVYALFDDEDMTEWSSEWPWFEEEPGRREAAIAKAEAGDPRDLIEMVRPQKRGRGRPRGSHDGKMDRVRRRPTHRAASMVSFAEGVLRDLYPEQSTDDIHDCALHVVSRWWRRAGHTGITVEKLENYLGRNVDDRRRLV